MSGAKKNRFGIGMLQKRRTLFADVPFDKRRHDNLMKCKAPKHRYAIFFTPRSGSTRIDGLLQAAQLSNRPVEYFNPRFMPDLAQDLSARDLKDYVAKIQRIRRKGQIRDPFGLEVTYEHLVYAFRTGERFMDIYQPHKTAWLMREDIIAQAVSVSRMMQTGVAHAPFSEQAKLVEADTQFVYKPSQIRHMVLRILWMENRTEALIRRQNLSTFRLSYEMTNLLGPTRVLDLLSENLDLARPAVDVHDLHQKLPGSKGGEYAQRFRHEHARFVTFVERRRASLQARIDHQKELYL